MLFGESVSITSVGEERACLSSIVYCFFLGGGGFPLGAWDGLRYFIVALPALSI